MLNRINALLLNHESFAFETTLATKSYKGKIIEANRNGYNTTLLFFWLKNANLAKERVRIRVLEGGHNIDSDVIDRRYIKGILNLFDIYLPIVDQVLVFDNSEGKPILIAEKSVSDVLSIIDKEKFNDLKRYYDNRG